MSSIPDTPTLSEWIVLIQRNPDQAQQHINSLRERINKQGFIVDPALIISVEHYEQAHQLLITALDNPDQANKIFHLSALGQATLDRYPDKEDWRMLIQNDPTFAQNMCIELEIKRAILGPKTPQLLQSSI